MDSLFSFIKSYIPSLTRDPQEDYLTQLFAWMLAHIPELGTRYCHFLMKKVQEPAFTIIGDEEIGIQTQVVVEEGRVDLLLSVGKHRFVCEHKVSSNLGFQQIERYANSFASHDGYFHTVLVTTTKLQHTQNADIQLVWADVSDFLIREREQYANENGFLIEQLIQYLQQQGLARMEPLSMENILGFFPGLDLPTKLENLMPHLQNKDWMQQCPGIEALNPGKYQPLFKKLRWGRIGVELITEKMSPSLFVGVMIDYKQIPSLDIVDRQLGPDVVIMLEYDYYPVPKDEYQNGICQQRKSLFAHQDYQTLCTQLQSTAPSTGFHFSKELPKSQWRIFVLQQPLATVLRGAQNENEQCDRLFATMCQGINLLTQDGLLAQALQFVRTESESLLPS